MEPPSEGNEATRGAETSEPRHSTREAGKPPQGTPWREGGGRCTELPEGQMPRTSSREPISTKQRKIADPRVHDGVTTVA